MDAPEQKRAAWIERVIAEVLTVNPDAADFAGASRDFIAAAFDASMSRKELVAAIVTAFATGEVMVLVPELREGSFEGWRHRLAVTFTKSMPEGRRKRAKGFAFNRLADMRQDFEADRSDAGVFEHLTREFTAYMTRRAAKEAKLANASIEANAQKPVASPPAPAKPAPVSETPKGD